MLNKKFVLKFLLDSCAAVSVGPTDVLNGSNIVMEESNCRIIAANGSISKVDGKLRFHFDNDFVKISAKEFSLLVQMANGAKDWLMSLPELSEKGFEAWLSKKERKVIIIILQNIPKTQLVHIRVFRSFVSKDRGAGG